MTSNFDGGIDKVGDAVEKSGIVYGLSMGRRAPMHCMHVDCIQEIARAGLRPVIVIGSSDGPESPLYDPVRNPLTVEQQKEQFRQAMGDIDYNEPLIITLDDNTNDAAWMQDFVQKTKELGLYGKSLVHLRSKAADAAATNPLSQYEKAFMESGFSVWHSYNSNPADDEINASDIRKYDLENLTVAQRRLIATPGYLVALARTARRNNPDRALMEQYNIPLTVLDLSLDRLYQEAGIRTADVIKAAGDNITLDNLIKAATTLVQNRTRLPANDAGPRKPILIVGPGVGAETADFLKNSGQFDIVDGSIGTFQSGEHFCELGYGEKAPATTKKKLKDASVVIVQSTAAPVGDNVIHLLEMIHTAKLHGAKEITVVTPFMAYARQDRSFDGRCTSQAIGMFAGLLKSAGADKVMTCTMHSQDGINLCREKFGDDFIPLSLEDVFAQHIREKLGSDVVIGAPDGAEKRQDEGQNRARKMADAFNGSALFKIRKTHVAASDTKLLSFEGDVAGKDCVLIDDMIDGGSTMINAAKALKERGAKSVTCCVTHAILTPGKDATALERLMLADVIDRMVMTDSVPDAVQKAAAFAEKYPARAASIEVLSLGPTLQAACQKALLPHAVKNVRRIMR